MSVLSSLTEIVTSGITWSINKILKAGGWAVAALVAVTTWITGTLSALVVGLIQPLISALPPMSQGLPEFGLWAFGLFVAPYVTPILAGLAIRFVIRRLPFIG